MRLCEPTTGAEFTLVGVHLKSGFPIAGPNDKDVAIAPPRDDLPGELAGWDIDVKLKPFDTTPTTDVIVMGDYNATETDYSLAPLYEGRELLDSRFVVSLIPQLLFRWTIPARSGAPFWIEVTPSLTMPSSRQRSARRSARR